MQYIIVPHAFDLAGKMTVEQMKEAAKLWHGASSISGISLEDGRMDAIRQVGPEFCFLSEFWIKVDGAKEYVGAAGVGAFAEMMRSHGFTNRDLEVMFEDNPAKALGLPITPENRVSEIAGASAAIRHIRTTSPLPRALPASRYAIRKGSTRPAS